MICSKYEKRQLKYLASLLNCKPSEIQYLCDNIASYYGKWIEVKTNKLTGKIKTYPDGTPKERIIRPSYGRLKQIQRAIKDNILAKVDMPSNVHGGVKGKSNITNAKVHQGKKYLFATDLQEFYPSINHKQVFRLFLDLGYSNHIAHWLTKLASIEFELPQGTPTSTAIANLIFASVDRKLIELTEKEGISYTRFVDDLTFSSPSDFRKHTVQMLEIVRQGGFSISYRKTNYKGRQPLTGVEVFNNYIDAPDKIKQKAKEEGTVEPSSQRPFSTYLKNIRKTNGNAIKAQKRTEQNEK